MRLSLPQLSYLQTSLGADTPIRPDGRSLTQFRPLTYSTSVLPLCLGSCQLSWGPFNLLVAVKGEVLTGSPSLELTVDVRSERDDDPTSVLLAETLDGLLKGGGDGHGIDMRDLEVVHDKAWSLRIDVVLLTTDGSSPLTAASLALRLALLDTRLPLTTPVGLPEDDNVADNGNSGRIGLGDFTVDDDFEHALPITSAQNVPILVLTNHCGPNTFFDASWEEEQVLTGRLAVAIVPQVDTTTTARTDPATHAAKRATRTDIRQGLRICMVRSIGCESARDGVQGLGSDPPRALSPLQIRRAIQDAVDVGVAITAAVDAQPPREQLDLFSVL